MRAIILSGGQNSRIRTNKALLRLGNRSVIEWILESLRPIFVEILIVTNDFESYRGLGCQLIPDLFPARGSLVGLYSGLTVSPSQYNFLVACDMPFLNQRLINYLVELTQQDLDSIDLLIPRTEKGYQPLHAIYSRNCLPMIKRQLEANNFRILDLLPRLRLKEVDQEELIRFDPQLLSFFNINTPEDWNYALAVFSRERGRMSG